MVKYLLKTRNVIMLTGLFSIILISGCSDNKTVEYSQFIKMNLSDRFRVIEDILDNNGLEMKNEDETRFISGALDDKTITQLLESAFGSKLSEISFRDAVTILHYAYNPNEKLDEEKSGKYAKTIRNFVKNSYPYSLNWGKDEYEKYLEKELESGRLQNIYSVKQSDDDINIKIDSLTYNVNLAKFWSAMTVGEFNKLNPDSKFIVLKAELARQSFYVLDGLLKTEKNKTRAVLLFLTIYEFNSKFAGIVTAEKLDEVSSSSKSYYVNTMWEKLLEDFGYFESVKTIIANTGNSDLFNK